MRPLINRASHLTNDMTRRPGVWLSRLVFLLGPWVCLWIVELLNENDLFADLDAWQISMNIIWYLSLFILCRLVLGRNRAAGAAAATACFLVGLLNHYILRFRGRILFPADLSGWRTAANVADAFDYSIDFYIVQSLVVFICYLFLLWMCKPRRKWQGLGWRATLALSVLIGGYAYAFFCTSMLPNLGIYTQQWVTQRNGFALNFTVALRYSSVERPADYSKQRVLELMEQYPALPAQEGVTRPANIVVVMNESFADFSIFDSFAPSEDPLPFLRTLQENTIKGWMYSPVTGGGTASVEFEYLTGFSTLFQPPHTVAYQLYVSKNMPSLAALARGQGYETTAFHPYKSSGWNRPLAYNYLSFDRQMYQEDVKAPYYIRGYISDLASYQTLFELTQPPRNSFAFNVTMQNHSSYAQGWRNLERSIKLPAELKAADKNAEQYMALAHASDKAIQALIEHYSAVEEPTLIVLFGDHQPPLTNAFYEALYGKKLSLRTTQELMAQYAVPFFLWANYPIPAQTDVCISPNYLGVLTAQTAGLPMTGYMNFLSQMHEALPVITPVGFLTDEGEYLERKELNQTQQHWLEQYELLNYCGMVDLFDDARAMFVLE